MIGLVSFKNDSGCPPLGLVQLATYLNQNGHPAEIIDFNWVDRFNPHRYRIIGISAMTKDYGKAIRLAIALRKLKKDVLIGGVHISTLPESLHPAFNAGIIGEGEETFKEYADGRKQKRIEGLVYYKKGSSLATTPPRKPIEDIDTLPRPDWSLVDERYFDYIPNTTWGKFCREGVMLTSRGCPFNCVFCSTKTFWGNKVRFHSAEYVKELIKDLKKKGVTNIQIWDDLFTINIPRLKQIAPLIEKLGMEFNCQPRTDLINDEVCKVLKSIGVKICIFGFESGNDRVLQYLKKNTTTVECNKKAIEICRNNGLGVQGSVIFASPDETLEEMHDTIKFIDYAFKKGAQRIWSFVLTPFPGTELWSRMGINWKQKGFRWEELSHQNKEALCLNGNIKRDEFDKVFALAKQKEQKFKYKKALSFIRNNPINTLRYIYHNKAKIKEIVVRGV